MIPEEQPLICNAVDMRRLEMGMPHAAERVETLIVGQDDHGDSLYIIAKGRVKVTLHGEGGREVILTIFRSGDFFGEMSLLTGEVRSATVKALEHATVIRVDKALFSTILASNPDIIEQLGKVMAQRQQDLSNEANKIQDKSTVQIKLISRIKIFFGL